MGETTPEQWESLLTDENATDLGVLTDPALSRAQLISILCATLRRGRNIRGFGHSQAVHLPFAGLYEKDVTNVLSACITEINATSSIGSGLKELGESVLTRYLRSTYVLDEEATALAAAQAAANVETVQLKKGDVIVRAGDVVTAEQMVLLRELDLLKGSESNGKIDIGAAVYVLLLYGGYITYMALYQRETCFNIRKMTLISIQLILVPGWQRCAACGTCT